MKEQIDIPTRVPTQTNSGVCELEQIEEMAKALTNYEYKLCERLPKDKCLLSSAIHAQVSCDYCKIAEFLYNAGYRKQSEGRWTYGVDREGTMKCTLCRRRMPKIDGARYCPNCGAKMKGATDER